ncbi:MAG: cysteine desulfurase [Chthonomonadaceae bacterium]|nr:cysteine desulfurase [Chthonomonadaceae bacterium]
MNQQNYFDNAATTPLDPEVLDAMLPYLQEDFGNANSLHQLGLRAREGVEIARNQVANLLGSAPEEIFFTSGATEANNWTLQSFPEVAVSGLEHSTIHVQALELGYGFLPNDGHEVETDGEQDLTSVTFLSNESGGFVRASKPEHGKFHRDVTQALGKIRIDLSELDLASMSAHKIYGPKGVGALYIKNSDPIEPLFYGGEQEAGLRAGTLNVPGIVGFGRACEKASELMDADWAHAHRLKECLLNGLDNIGDWQSNSPSDSVPHLLSLSFLDLLGESLVVEADSLGFCISSGPACSSRSNELSHVLAALGVPDDWSQGTVRISFGRQNTLETTAALSKVLVQAVKSLRSAGRRA